MVVWTGTNKNIATWTGTSRHAASFTATTKSLGPNSLLLLESGSYLLLEDGASKLILEQSNPSGPAWIGTNKS